MKAPRLLCVGALTMDKVYRLPRLPAESGKYLATSAAEVTAGMAASAAIAAARLGGEVELWASLGDDAAGDRLLNGMNSQRVGCRFVRRVPGAASPSATIVVDDAGERMVIAHYAPEIVAAPSSLPDLASGNFGAVLADARWVAASDLALNWARGQGLPAILDADVAALADLQQLLPLATHVVASAAGAAIATRQTDPMVALSTLAALSRGFSAVTLGAEGCIWTEGAGAPIVHAAAPRVSVVDSNAAGDVFHGAFALALAESMPHTDAIRFASAAAALKCTRLGSAIGAPSRTELSAFMAQQAHLNG